MFSISPALADSSLSIVPEYSDYKFLILILGILLIFFAILILIFIVPPEFFFKKISNNIKHPAIFILGAPNVGKSTLGNMLLENCPSSQKFSISNGAEEWSHEKFRSEEIEIERKKYSIVDTNGLSEHDLPDITRFKLLSITQRAAAYILVIEGGRIKANELLFIGQFFKDFPIPLTRVIVVFTKVRKSLISNDDESDETNEAMRNTLCKDVRNYLNMINDRWISIPNTDSFNEEEGKKIIKKKVNALMSKINEVGKVEDSKSSFHDFKWICRFYLHIKYLRTKYKLVVWVFVIALLFYVFYGCVLLVYDYGRLDNTTGDNSTEPKESEQNGKPLSLPPISKPAKFPNPKFPEKSPTDLILI